MGLTSSGILRYSPKRLGAQSSTNWWLVVDCDEQIGKYYRYLYFVGNYRTKSLKRPAWKEHISVIRNEQPSAEYQYLWEKYSAKRIDFRYEPKIYDDGEYFWLRVECEALLDIREELRLPREPKFPLHLSIGHI